MDTTAFCACLGPDYEETRAHQYLRCHEKIRRRMPPHPAGKLDLTTAFRAASAPLPRRRVWRFANGSVRPNVFPGQRCVSLYMPYCAHYIACVARTNCRNHEQEKAVDDVLITGRTKLEGDSPSATTQAGRAAPQRFGEDRREKQNGIAREQTLNHLRFSRRVVADTARSGSRTAAQSPRRPGDAGHKMGTPAVGQRRNTCDHTSGRELWQTWKRHSGRARSHARWSYCIRNSVLRIAGSGVWVL